jgi:hypothetical protein
MKTYFTLITIITILYCTACYEDKGHYDYLPSNPVTISNGSANAVMGEMCRFKPEIVFANPNDTTGFEYWWEYIGDNNHYMVPPEFICNGRELQFVPKVIGAQRVRLHVKEVRTGVITSKTFIVSGTSLYNRGWLILTEKAGLSGLSMVVPDRDSEGARVYRSYLDLWEKLSPDEELGRNPVALKPIHLWSGTMLLLLQGNGGSVSLNGDFYRKEIVLSREFVGGVPTNLSPVDYYQSNYAGMLLNGDRNCYFRSPYDGSSTDLFTYSFANFPMQYAGEALTIDQIIPGLPGNARMFLLHDKIRNRLLWVYDGDRSTAGAIVRADIQSPPAEHLDYNNLTGVTILYSGFYNGDLSGITEYNITLYEKGGDLYVQRCKVTAWWQGMPIPANGVPITEVQHNEFPGKAYISPETRYYQLKARTYLFFATGNQLYWYDHTTKNVHPFYTFGAGDEVVKMSSNIQESELAVLLKSGNFISLDITNANLMGTNNKLYEITIPGDRMVDMEYKFQDYMSYMLRTFFSD